MKYLRLFQTKEEYNDAYPSLALPNVSLIVSSEEVKYLASLLPLYVEAIEDLTVSFSTNDIEYSLDNETWQTLSAGTNTPTIQAGERVYFAASNLTVSSSVGIGSFSMTGKCNIGGDISSMINGKDARNTTTVPSSYFRNLFYPCANIIDATSLLLPATSLGENCYRSMFNSCTGLISAPKVLPAESMSYACYNFMFKGCSSLKNAPQILATSVAESCFSGMFQDCVILSTAPDLLPTSISSRCYENMFNGCSSLTYIKAMFLTEPSSSTTAYWVYGVALYGTFVKNSAATWNVTGNNGIPSGWTVETADA